MADNPDLDDNVSIADVSIGELEQGSECPPDVRCRQLIAEVEVIRALVDGTTQVAPTTAQKQLQRLEQIEEQFFKFLDNYISRVDTPSDYSTISSDFHSTYFNVHNKLSLCASSSIVGSASSTPLAVCEATSKLHLAPLEIPDFSGIHHEWPKFEGLFRRYVHDKSYDNHTKFVYLLQHLKDKALHSISSLPITGENYIVAWELLQKRYDNPSRQLHSHLKAIADCPSLPNIKLSWGKPLEEMITSFWQHAQGICAIFDRNPSIHIASQFIIFTFLSKVNDKIRKKWEEGPMQNNKFPTFQEFLHFMEDQQQHRAESNRGESHRTRDLPSSSSSTPLRRRFTGAVLPTSSFYGGCYYCNSKKHYLPKCEKFINLLTNDRYCFVKEAKLCTRCLCRKCNSATCRRGFCGRCTKGHHSLLHGLNLRRPLASTLESGATTRAPQPSTTDDYS